MGKHDHGWSDGSGWVSGIHDHRLWDEHRRLLGVCRANTGAAAVSRRRRRNGQLERAQKHQRC